MTTVEIIQRVFVTHKITRDPFQNSRTKEDRRAQDSDRQDYAVERRIRPERRLPEILYVEVDEHIVIHPARRFSS